MWDRLDELVDTRAERDEDGVVDGEVVEDDDAEAEAVWQQIVMAAGKQGMSLPDLEDDFAARMGGLVSSSASAAELRSYLGLLTGEAVLA